MALAGEPATIGGEGKILVKGEIATQLVQKQMRLEGLRIPDLYGAIMILRRNEGVIRGPRTTKDKALAESIEST